MNLKAGPPIDHYLQIHFHSHDLSGLRTCQLPINCTGHPPVIHFGTLISVISCISQALAPALFLKKRIAGQRLWVDGVPHSRENSYSCESKKRRQDMYVSCFWHGKPTVGCKLQCLNIHFEPWFCPRLGRFFFP